MIDNTKAGIEAINWKNTNIRNSGIVSITAKTEASCAPNKEILAAKIDVKLIAR